MFAVVAIAIGGLWLARKPVARHYIGDTLHAAGVPATYAIADLNFGRQRLTDVVIGDPASPDLVADWVETRTAIGLSGPYVTGVRAGRVRIRARLVDERVSLGTLDRLLPAPSGKPFALPALTADVDDARIRLETAFGLVGMKIAGKGRLNDGFDGRLAAVAPRLMAGGCTVESLNVAVRIRIDAARPHLTGPVRAGRTVCGGSRLAAPRVDLDATVSAAFDRWRGSGRIATAALDTSVVRAAAVSGTVGFAGSAATTRGTLDLSASRVRMRQASAATLTANGGYRLGRATSFVGRIAVRGAAVAPALLARDPAAALAGTPLASLAARAAQAVRAGGRRFDAEGDVAAAMLGARGTLRVSRLALAAASGARLALSGGDGVSYAWPRGGVRLDASLAVSGGGLPSVRLALAQAGPGAPLRGRGQVTRYAAGDASLALDAIAFTATPGGATRIATRATLSGPFAGGRVDALTMPLTAIWDGRTTLVVNTACTPLGFDRLAVSGLVVDRSAVTLCPVDGALLRLADGRVSGGARTGAMRLGGRLGTTPVAVQTAGAELRFADRAFALDTIAARIGAPARVTRLDFARIDGRLTPQGIAGTFTGGGGQIANVPLVMAGAAGDWTFARGALALTGALGVTDAAADPRFKPLGARGVTLGLAGGTITVAGTLVEPTRGVTVAEIGIVHALGSGRGAADIAVEQIAFTETFQPDLLTPLTFGVIADVRGPVSGTGRIDWNADGVASTGRFRTPGLDLAAAFGPVTGLAGEIVFTDLLALQSAPGQVARVASINPGIPVTDGTIRYQTLPDTRVRVEGARWPFAGGELTLDPTLLDFSETGSRRMTFRVHGAAADRFLQQFDFKNLNATGTFDGVLPMIFDAQGGRIENGTLEVREGGGTLAYVGDLSQKDLGFWSNLAFQALRSLRYRSLGLTMNGPLAGEMVTEVRFAGVSQGEGAKANFLVRRLQKLPFVFNIRIKAPFRGLLDSAQSFYDPKRLVQRNLQPLLDAQNKLPAVPPQPATPALPPTPPAAVQPPASRTVP